MLLVCNCGSCGEVNYIVGTCFNGYDLVMTEFLLNASAGIRKKMENDLSSSVLFSHRYCQTKFSPRRWEHPLPLLWVSVLKKPFWLIFILRLHKIAFTKIEHQGLGPILLLSETLVTGLDLQKRFQTQKARTRVGTCIISSGSRAKCMEEGIKGQ